MKIDWVIWHGASHWRSCDRGAKSKVRRKGVRACILFLPPRVTSSQFLSHFRVAASSHFRPSPLLGKTIALLCLICCLVLSACQPRAPQGTAVQIQRVLSGQTVEWTDNSQQPPTIRKVRLIGIEAPDWQQQPWSGEAKVALEKILGLDSATADSPAILEFDLEAEDDYGRSLAYVWKDGILVNEELAKQGYVLAVSRSPNTKYERELAYAQDYARVMGLGIWRSDRPMRQTPVEFQRQKQ